MPQEVSHDALAEGSPSVESLLQAWGGHVALLSPSGRVSWVSSQWDATMREFGLTALTCGNDYWHALQSALTTHSERIDALLHAIEQVRQHEQSRVAIEMAWSSRQGRRHIRVDVTALTQGFVVLQMRDISPAPEPSHDLMYMAYHDAVTGLPNRFAALSAIDQAIRRCSRTNQGMGVVFCDIDDFKDVNDRFGHLIGDAVLHQIGTRWREWTRQTDTLARISGDEFVLIADGVSGATELAGLVHRLAAALSNPVTVDSHSLRITASFGAVYLDSTESQDMTNEALLTAADQALYAAKRHGRDQLIVRTMTASTRSAAVAQA